MFLKIKNFFLLFFLVLLQSCSGGSIGNFLESSFYDVNINNKEKPHKLIDNKYFNIPEKEADNKNNVQDSNKEENLNKRVGSRDFNSLEKKEDNEKDVEDLTMEEKSNKFLNINEFVNSEKKSQKKSQKIKKINKAIKTYKSTKIRNDESQTYKIIFILKDVDPKNPIEELSTILSNSEVNFEIEKIERFFDSKNKNMNRN